LLESLIHFAEKIKAVANNMPLWPSQEPNSRLLRSAVGLTTSQGRMTQPKSVIILQQLSNTLLIQADDIVVRRNYDDDLVNEKEPPAGLLSILGLLTVEPGEVMDDLAETLSEAHERESSKTESKRDDLLTS
jgi:hypothetical protein